MRQALEPLLQDEVYRVTSEVLRNAVQHAEASQIEAEVRYEQSATEETMKGHITHILRKLGANDRTHAVTIGLQRGIIELSSPKSRIEHLEY
jgi:DNA-binding CsgD family transcriptional regulator